MASPQALASLKILAGGPMGQRVLPSEDYGFSGATPTQGELSSPFEMEQSQRAAAADARDRATTEKIQATNAAVYEHNRPDVKAIQDEQEADALKRLLLPIQMKGQFDVEAAKQAQIGRAQRDEQLAESRSGLRTQQDEALAERGAANSQEMIRRQRLAGLQSGKAHAPRPSGIMDSLFGPSQKALDDAEIAQLLQSGGGQMAPAGPAVAPTGGPETAAQQLARLRAGR